MDEVRVYVTERVIDGHRYGDNICARSREEADELAARLGGVCVRERGELQCARCSSPLGMDGAPLVAVDEWPDDAIREIP